MSNHEQQLRYLVYKTPETSVSIDVLVKDETIWATQKVMSELFGVGVPAISKHLANIFEDGELTASDMTISKMETVVNRGFRGEVVDKVDFYSLDAVIAVGYRVNSKKATAFRIWATNILTEYIKKGFVLDDERLKYGEQVFGKDYFRELLERVRSIRASERRIWQQITDIFAEISIDYDKDSEITKQFYATVQNKFHFAITGKTAAEIVYNSADRQKSNMGLTTWKNSPSGRILKSDTEIAKNYLSETQIRRLERSVSGFFDYVEDLIEGERLLTMDDFAKSIDEFISFRKWKILGDKGKISHQKALAKAHTEYDEFNKTQDILSDFDRAVKKIEGGE
jgi:hypothetical protein